VLGFFNEAWWAREVGGQAHIGEGGDGTLDLVIGVFRNMDTP